MPSLNIIVLFLFSFFALFLGRPFRILVAPLVSPFGMGSVNLGKSVGRLAVFFSLIELCQISFFFQKSKNKS